jgi:type IV secretion system protein VirB9
MHFSDVNRSLAARALVAGGLLALAGCADLTALPGKPDPAAGELTRATLAPEPAPAPPEPPRASGELVGPEDPEIQAALQAFKAGNPAPIIRTEEFIQYPHGLTEAVLTCEPLRVCDIELETGEEILSLSLGDSSRWLATPAFSGAHATLTPHVIVKPTEYGIVTNAVITTTRRTYYLGLVSKQKGDPGHVRRIKFYYPRDLLQEVNGLLRARQAASQREHETTVARLPRLSVEALNFGYEVSEGQGLPWRPVRVFDDGRQVYIQMPEAMRASEAPVLLVQTRGGEAALVNYRLRSPYYVVDKLFESAVLIVGVGQSQERVTIRRAGATR